MKKIFKIFIAVISIIAILVPIRFYLLGNQSQEMNVSPSLTEDNTLKPCGKKPNCVSSFQNKDDGHYVAPLNLRATKLLRLDSLLEELNCKRFSTELNYWRYVCSSRIFNFADDLELLFNPSEEKLYFRSASRVGYSDLDANRKRVKKIKDLLRN